MKLSVVPVACGYVNEKGQWTIVDIEGTGFFVDRSGRFVTAAHVLVALDAVMKTKHACTPAIYIPDNGWGQFQKKFTFQYFNFSHCKKLDSVDVAVCTPQENPFKSPRIGRDRLHEVAFDTQEISDGTPIAFTAFPLESTSPITSIGNVGSKAVMNDTDAWFFYVIDKTIWPGASGSPVYTGEGKVIGMSARRGEGKAEGVGYARCAAAIVDFLSKNPPDEANK